MENVPKVLNIQMQALYGDIIYMLLFLQNAQGLPDKSICQKYKNIAARENENLEDCVALLFQVERLCLL